MSGNTVANILIKQLLKLGFIVHRYDSKSTSSIYLKLDYGVACGIRIADHSGKKKYRYRFNVIKDYVGDKAIYKDGLICLFFSYKELDNVIEAVINEKTNKIKKYGIDKYKFYMEQENRENALFTRFKEIKEGEIYGRNRKIRSWSIRNE